MIARLPELRRLAVKHHAMGLALGYKFVGAALSFAITFVVARVAGPRVIGEYAMMTVTVALLAIVAVFGQDQIIARTVAGDLAEGKSGAARAALRQTLGFVLPASLVVALALLAASYFTPAIGLPTTLAIVGAATLLIFPAWRVVIQVVRATGALAASQFLDSLAHNILILSGVGVLLVLGAPIASLELGLLFAGALAVVVATAAVVMARRTRDWAPAVPRGKAFLRQGLFVFSAIGCQSLAQWVVLAMIGYALSAEDVGAFRVVVQIVTSVVMMYTTVEQLQYPNFASDYRAKNFRAARRRHVVGTGLMAALALPPLLLCIFAPSLVLSLFGAEFTVARNALVIMTLGHIATVLTGPCGAMMLMAGKERITLRVSLASLALTLILAPLLIPRWGLEGAALAAIGPVAMRNILMLLIVQRDLRRWIAASHPADAVPAN